MTYLRSSRGGRVGEAEETVAEGRGAVVEKGRLRVYPQTLAGEGEG